MSQASLFSYFKKQNNGSTTTPSKPTDSPKAAVKQSGELSAKKEPRDREDKENNAPDSVSKSNGNNNNNNKSITPMKSAKAEKVVKIEETDSKSSRMDVDDLYDNGNDDEVRLIHFLWYINSNL